MVACSSELRELDSRFQTSTQSRASSCHLKDFARAQSGEPSQRTAQGRNEEKRRISFATDHPGAVRGYKSECDLAVPFLSGK